jgi:hypothetical protein
VEEIRARANLERVSGRKRSQASLASEGPVGLTMLTGMAHCSGSAE